jgi:hypothetical protein
VLHQLHELDVGVGGHTDQRGCDPRGRKPDGLMRVSAHCNPHHVCDEHDAREQLGGDRQPHQQGVTDDPDRSSLFGRKQDGRDHRAEGGEAVAPQVSAVVYK